MNCIVCHGTEVEAREVSEQVRVGDDIVYVPVRTPVCLTCGERYYDRATMLYLEEMEDRLKRGEMELREVGRVLSFR